MSEGILPASQAPPPSLLLAASTVTVTESPASLTPASVMLLLYFRFLEWAGSGPFQICSVGFTKVILCNCQISVENLRKRIFVIS